MEGQEALDRTDFDLRGLFAAMRRRIPLIALFFLAVAGLTFLVSSLQTKQYTAEASLLFRDPGFDQQLFGQSSETIDPEREAATNIGLISLDVVADRTAEDLGEVSGDDVAAMVDIQPEGQADLASVTATDSDPEFAAAVANSFAANYIAFRREADRAKIVDAQRLLERELDERLPEQKGERQTEALQAELGKLRALEAVQTGNAELVQEAEVPTSASSPKTARNAVLGGILGLLLGIGAALLLERLDRRLRQGEDFGDHYGLPVLAHVPESDMLGNWTSGDALGFAENEAFRMLRTRLRYFNVDRDLRSLIVTSALPGEGKSTVSWNIAYAAARAGTRTILIEADFHQPVFAERIGLPPLPGLSELLTHQGSLEGTMKTIPVKGGAGGETTRGLDVIVAGSLPPNPTELLESEEIRALLADLSSRYELVVIDTPPVAVMSDAMPLIGLVSGLVIVGRLGVSTRDAAGHLREQLNRLRAPALGVVVNGTRIGRGYGYAYGYGYGPDAAQPRSLSRFNPFRRKARRPSEAMSTAPLSSNGSGAEQMPAHWQPDAEVTPMRDYGPVGGAAEAQPTGIATEVEERTPTGPGTTGSPDNGAGGLGARGAGTGQGSRPGLVRSLTRWRRPKG